MTYFVGFMMAVIFGMAAISLVFAIAAVWLSLLSRIVEWLLHKLKLDF